jgi:hypothetical protein
VNLPERIGIQLLLLGDEAFEIVTANGLSKRGSLSDKPVTARTNVLHQFHCYPAHRIARIDFHHRLEFECS